MVTVDRFLTEYVANQAIPIFAITGVEYLEHALPGWQPADLLPSVNSLLIFGAPFIEHSRTVDERTPIANESGWRENVPVFDQISDWRGGIVNILDHFGYGTANYGGSG